MINSNKFPKILILLLFLWGILFAQGLKIENVHVQGRGGREITYYRPSVPMDDWWYNTDVECIHDIGCVDIVFCVDTSGSMSGTIGSLQDEIDRFAYDIAAVGFDYSFGLVTYSETVNFPHGATLIGDLGAFSAILDEARGGEGGYEDHSQAIYDAVTSFDWRPGCESIVILVSDECDDASSVTPSTVISTLLSWGGTVYMMTADCGDVDEFHMYCDTTYGMWFDYSSSTLNDVFNQIIDDIADVVEIDITVTNTSGGVMNPMTATLIPDFCITVGDSPNPQPYGPVADGANHTFVWDITEIPGCTGWGDCFMIRVEGGGYVDSIVGCLFVEDCGCPGPEVVILCPEYSGAWTACDYQQIEIQFEGYMGVNQNSLCIQVNGTEYCYPHPNLTWTPSGTGGVLTFTPSSPWTHLDDVDIVVTAGLDATDCPIRFYPESDFNVDTEPPHVGWWEHHDATLWPPSPPWREWHDGEVAWSPPCGDTLSDTDHITFSALIYDDGIGVTPVDLILKELESMPGFDFGTIWSSLTSIQLTVNGIPFIPGVPIPGEFNRAVDFDLTYVLAGDQFGGWQIDGSIRADSAFMLGLFSPEMEFCIEAHDLVEAEGCMPCENDTQWCCTFWLLEDIPLTVNAGPDQYICAGEAVMIGGTPAAAGGTTPYTYSWTPTTGLSDPNTANPLASPTTTTTYTLTVTDDASDVATDDMTVYVSNPVADAGEDDTVCAGASLTLGGSPTGSGGFPPLSYSWEPAAYISPSNIANPTLTTDVAWDDTTIMCIVTVTDTLGCEDIDTVLVTIDNIIPDAGPDRYICVGDAVTIGGSPTATGGVPPYTFNWYEYPGGTLVSNDANPSVTPTDTTTYVVEIIGDDPYCNATDTCIVYPVEVSADAGPDQDVCVGGSVVIGGTPTASGSGGYSYSWTSVPPGYSSIESNPIVSPTGNTSYIVTVTDSIGCTDVDTVQVEVFPAPFGWVAVPDFCGGVSSCEYQSVIWTIIDTVGTIDESTIRVTVEGITYDVTDPEITTSVHLTDSISIMFSPVTPWDHGDTIVFELDNVASYAGCSTAVPACSFIVDLEPPIADPLVPPDSSYIFVIPDSIGAYIEDFPAGVDPLSFNYISITVDGVPATGWTYSWSGGYLSINNLVIEDGDSVVICLDSLFDDPDYDYCAHNDTSLCWWFMIMPCDVEVTASPDTVICGGGDIILNADVEGGSGFFTYEWTPDVGLDDSSLPNPIATIESTIIYVVEVYDESLMCSAYDTVSIIASNPVANTGPDGLICPYSNVPLGCVPTVTGGIPPYIYEWMDSTGTVLYTEEHPLHFFEDMDEWFVLHVIDSIGCEDWDTVYFDVDWEEIISVDLLTPLPDETLAVGDVYFDWEVDPPGSYLYDFLIDDAIVFDHIDSSNVTIDFPCGESHTWTIVVWKECLHEYIACGETTITEFIDSIPAPFDPPFHMEDCGEPYAVEVHVPDGDWTACDPDSIVAFIIDSVGIIESSIVMTVNGTEYTTADPELTWDGVSTLVFRPSTMWADGEIVSVCVDSAMNVDSMTLIAPVCWDFYIDRSAPEIVSITPTPFSEIPTTVESIQVCIRDDLSGLDSLIMDVDGVLYELGPYGCVDTTVCEWFPVGPLSPGDVADVYLVRATDCPDWCGPNVLDSVWDYTVSDCDVEITFDLGVAETLICHPDSLPVVFELTTTVTGGTGPFTYWNTMEGLVGPAHVSDPTYHLDHSTLISIIVVDADSCIDTASFVVYISDLEANAGPDLEICEGDSVEIGRLAYRWSGPFIGGIDYWWTYEDGTFLSDELNPLVWPDVTTNYVFHVTDSIGCEDADTMAVIRNHESPGTFTGLYPPPDAMLPPGDITIIWSDAGGVPPANYHLIIDGVDTVAMGIPDTFFTVNYPCGHTHSWEVIAYNLCASEMIVSSDSAGRDSIEVATPPDTFYGGIDTSIYDPIFHTHPCEGPSAIYAHVPSGDWTACDPDSIVWILDDSVTYIESTIEVVVNGVSYTTSDGELSWDGSEYLIFRPSPMWVSGTTVQACLTGVMSIDSLWLPDSVCGEFYVDFDPPVIWAIDPPPETIIAAPAFDYVDFRLYDYLSGLNDGSVTIVIGAYSFGFTDPVVSWDGDSILSIDLSGYDFDCGDTIEICLHAEDSPDWCGPNELDSCWEIITEPCESCLVWIDSVWFSEETDCDSLNTVEICYVLSSDCPDSVYPVSIALSQDDGTAWPIPLDSIWEAEGDIGDSVMPGLHCFYWEMSDDWPDEEGTFLVRATTGYGCCLGEGLRMNGTPREVLLLGEFAGESFSLDASIDYFEGDVVGGETWFADSVDSSVTIGGTGYPGTIWFNDRYGWATSHSYTHFYICAPFAFDTTVHLRCRPDDDLAVWLDGTLLFEEHDHVATIFHDVPLELEACEWHSLYLWNYDSGGPNNLISFYFSDASDNPIDWLHTTIAPSESFTTTDTAYYSGPLDSRPPLTLIDCPTVPLSVGIPNTFAWLVEDSFWVGDICSLHFFGCDIDEEFITVDTFLSWTPPSPCSSCTLAIAVRDSFCNWGYDTCVFEIATGVVTASIIEPLTNTTTTCNDQAIIMEIVGSEATTTSKNLLWLTDNGYASGKLSDGGAIGYSHAAESLMVWGWNVDEINQTEVLTSAILNPYDVVVIGNIKSNGPRTYTSSERTALSDFVANGGKVLAISGWVVEDYDITTENFLLSDIGIYFEPYEDWTSWIPPEPGSPIESGVTQVPGNGCKWIVGLDECWAYRSSDCACGTKHYGAGEVVTYFDEHWLFNGPWHSMDFTTHQNATLFRNIFTYLEPSLDSFPCPIDPATIVLRVEGFDYTVADGELDWMPDVLTFTPSSPLWTHNQLVDVCLMEAEDSCGAVLPDSICWQFTVDLEPPELAELEPPCGSAIVPGLNDHWDITLVDIPAGVMPDSTFMILGDDTCHITGGGGDTMTFTFDPGDYGITFVAGDTITLCIETMDGPVDYCEPNDTIYCCDYPIFPSEGPIAYPIRVPPDSISACEPESIIVEIISEFEVVESTIVLNVDGIDYVTTDPQLTWLNPFLTYLPNPDWNEHDTVYVRLASAKDIFDNQYVNYPLEWIFYIDRVEPQSEMTEPPNFTRDILDQIVIILTDLLSGINPNGLILEVEGVEYHYPSDFDWNWNSDGLGGSIIWNPVAHGIEYNAGDTIDVNIYAEDSPDLCGPNIHAASYSFIVEPWTPCMVNPNPFSPNGDTYNEITAFDWPNMTTEGATIYIFDVRNILIKKIELEPQRNYEDYPVRAWDGKDNEGKYMPQGLYLYVIESDGRIVCNGTVILVR